MASILRDFVQVFKDYPDGDPRMKDYFIMKSPSMMLSTAILYLLFVHKIGPKMMENRKPLDLKYVMVLYNIVQIVLNLGLWIQIATLVPYLSITCTPVDRSTTPIGLLFAKVHHNYIALKLLDLLDTIFFVLRKKDKQISFLHVHHHVGVFMGAWVCGKYFPGGHITYTGLLNTLVHVIMYSYYLLTSWDSSYGQQIWLKKSITKLQIIQHYVVFVVHLLPVLKADCTYPKVPLILYLANVVFMISLFSNFYRKAYGSEKSKVKL